MSDQPAELRALRERLTAEESAYAEALARLDELASFQLPMERLTDLPEQMRQLNELWTSAPPPERTGLGGWLERSAWRSLQPALQRQQAFNSALVQALNSYLAESARIDARFRDLAAALVGYAQRMLPTVDARDRLASALGTTRAELILESFDRRQEALGRRVEGLLALRDRTQTLTSELEALRGALAEPGPPPPLARRAEDALDDAVYVAFEARFRGSPAEVSLRLREYVELFGGLAPVADLGCGRGEFLELLREAGVAGLGIEANGAFVQECRAKGLDVRQGDLVEFLEGQTAASLGGVFASQVVEHLPPAVLVASLRAAHAALRPGGLLVLETVNPRSVIGFLEVFNRDLSHEKPLHPDTLSFLAAAAGFCEVRVELRSPVEADACLSAVPAEDLPPRVAQALNENVARLNGLLYGPREYVLFARR